MKNNLSLFLFAILIIVFSKACVPPEYNREKYTGISVDFDDKQVQEIYNLLERQSTDSLMRFLTHQNPTYRYMAANAFGSMKDKKGIDTLAKLLKDEFVDVRTAAAFALGQIGDVRAENPLLSAYEARDTTGKFAKFNAALLEAVGKCGTTANLTHLCRISTFKMSDSTLIEGQVYGIYRYGLRDTFNVESIKKMTAFVAETRFSRQTRLVAASYLGRIKTKYDTSVTNTLSKIVLSERDANVRMALAKALGKSTYPLSILPVFENLYRQETDPRVKINILNAVADLEYPKIQTLVMTALREKDLQVSNVAAQILVSNGSIYDGQLYKSLSTDATAFGASTRRILQGAALKWLTNYPKSRDSLYETMLSTYRTTANNQEKAEILRGIAGNGLNYPFLTGEALNSQNTSLVRTTAATALAEIATASDFSKTFKTGAFIGKRDLKTALFACIRTGDVGIAAVAADALANPKGEYNLALLKDSIPVIYETLQRLKLPEQVETYDALYKLITTIDPTSDIKKKNILSPRATDWMILKGLQNGATATVKMAKGTIKMQLFTQNAPISVSNFVSLARSGFFNGKAFHRVVANFVVQTGCPRGDGYGSLDYTIATELSPMHYDMEGLVGMASVGNHTECSQWFITHSPTLHLDTNYTIFAKVIEGMSLVQQIEMGDVIESVTIN